MSKRVIEMMNDFTQRDYDALKSIYDFRCLSFDQLFNRHYRFSEDGTEVTNGYFRKKILEFERKGLVEKVESYNVEPVYFLTRDGVTFVKNAFNFPNNVYDSRKQLHVQGYLTSSELSIAPTFISHQYHLNQFVLDFLNRFKDIKNYRYQDEKHIKNYVGIRPDAILRMLDIDFFLEMDMGTEDIRHLREKWRNYRRFIQSNEFAMKEHKIIVFFIIEGVNPDQIGARKDLIKRTIYEEVYDLLDKDMEIYVDTKDHLLDIVETKIFPSEKGNYINHTIVKNTLNKDHGFEMYKGEAIAKYLNNEIYEYYIKKVDPNTRKIVVEDGKVQEYLLEDFTYSPMSVLNKIFHLSNRNTYYYHHFKRTISMIVLVDDENFIYNQMNLFQAVDIPNVYFTTAERLSTLPFYKAVFQYDENGNKFSFKNNKLEEREYETSNIIL